ncbi:EXS domain-containing protein [Ordospora pajunii]|uniref:EXS domain-containing protein n=1 Tax=Ordospora pajunii TaxID=3039483 RepID=UPI002952910F|nr:EXS domain-containing protein [Ordospora pajunii]KAH9410908.1 EXS domain-containing protein [Ordospora pajunii]
MRFSSTLRANQVDEWKESYVSYDILKPMITGNKNGFKVGIEKNLAAINDFFFMLEKQAVAEKNDIFADVSINLAEGISQNGDAHIVSKNAKHTFLSDTHKARNVNLGGKLAISQSTDENPMTDEDDLECKYAPQKDTEKRFGGIFKIPKQLERRKREKNIQEFLHAVIGIKRFRELNYTGLMKLSKKYGKTYPSEGFHKSFSKKIDGSYFSKSKRIDEVYSSIKELYKTVFARNDPGKARTVFRKLKRKNTSNPIALYASGMLGGMSIGLIPLLDFGENKSSREMFFATVLLQYGAFLFGLCLSIFKRFHINYKFIFNFDVCSSLTSDRYLLMVSAFIFINIACTWANIVFFHVSPYWIPIAGFLVMLVPFQILYHQSRFYLASVIFRILVLPMSHVRFRHFYFADVGQSFTVCFKKIFLQGYDLDWRLDGAISSFFAIVRLSQCLKRYKDTGLKFPHIANALKYALTIAVGITAALYEKSKTHDALVHKAMSMAISSICSSAWDIFMDWGMIRGKMMYPRHVYAAGVVFNLACRFSWLLLYAFSIPVLWMQFLEITRRFVWTLFRVEFEHLNNCSEFKAKGSIWFTSNELFYRKDYEVNTENTETENESSTY